MAILNDLGELEKAYLFSSLKTEEETFLDTLIDAIPAENVAIVLVNGSVDMPRNPVFYTAL